MEVRCVVDGRAFQAQRASAKYCSERCKKRAQRDPSRVHVGPASGTAQPLAPVAHLAASSPSPATGLGVWRRTHDELTKAGRLETVSGAIALALASRMDDPGMDTGSSVAAVAKQLEATLARALDGTQVAETPLEKIRREREMKAG